MWCWLEKVNMMSQDYSKEVKELKHCLKILIASDNKLEVGLWIGRDLQGIIFGAAKINNSLIQAVCWIL